MKTRTFKIPVTWTVYSTIEVEAETLEEAIEKFDEVEDSDFGHDLPSEFSYVDDSFERGDYESCLVVNTNYEN